MPDAPGPGQVGPESMELPSDTPIASDGSVVLPAEATVDDAGISLPSPGSESEPTPEDAVALVRDYYAAINGGELVGPTRCGRTAAIPAGSPCSSSPTVSPTPPAYRCRSMRLAASMRPPVRASSRCRWRSTRSSATAAYASTSAHTCCVARRPTAPARNNDSGGSPRPTSAKCGRELRAGGKPRARIIAGRCLRRRTELPQASPSPSPAPQRAVPPATTVPAESADPVELPVEPDESALLLPGKFGRARRSPTCRRCTARPVCGSAMSPGPREPLNKGAHPVPRRSHAPGVYPTSMTASSRSLLASVGGVRS